MGHALLVPTTMNIQLVPQEKAKTDTSGIALTSIELPSSSDVLVLTRCFSKPDDENAGFIVPAWAVAATEDEDDANMQITLSKVKVKTSVGGSKITTEQELELPVLSNFKVLLRAALRFVISYVFSLLV